MVVNSHNVEFGYELIAALPYAYWHKKNGSLSGTVSGPGSEPLYFFSPRHEINPAPRDWANTEKAAREIPNMRIHKPMLDLSQWEPPPIADHYRPMAITFNKPTVVVYNRYNREWGQPPINFFDLPTLRSLFRELSPKYQVVYFNVRGEESLEDNAHSMALGDFEMIQREFPQVKVIHDLVAQHGGNYNEVQLRIFAGCKKFITMNGGPSILASYFGGESIIYSRKCKELLPGVNSFYNWYHLFGGSDITVVRTHAELLDKVVARWVRGVPKINVLLRMHNRPHSAKTTVASVLDQKYPNVRIIASYDNAKTWAYAKSYPFTKISVSPSLQLSPRPDSDDYRAWLPSNEYFNHLYDLVQDGLIIFLDDDDFLLPGSLESIAWEAATDRATFFRAMCHGKLYPNGDKVGVEIIPGNISGLGICVPANMKGHALWEPWRRGDYRVARNLAKVAWPKWSATVIASTGSKDQGQQKASINGGRAERAAEINKRAKAMLEAVERNKREARRPPAHRVRGR